MNTIKSRVAAFVLIASPLLALAAPIGSTDEARAAAQGTPSTVRTSVAQSFDGRVAYGSTDAARAAYGAALTAPSVAGLSGQDLIVAGSTDEARHAVAARINSAHSAAAQMN